MSAPWVIAFCVLSAVVVVQAVAIIGLQGRVSATIARVEAFLGTSDLEERFRGLPEGALAPALPARHLTGPLARVGSGTSALLLFVEPGCDPCDTLLREVGTHVEPIPGVQPVLVVQPSAGQAPPSMPAQWSVVAQEDREASRSYHVSAVPYAYLVDEVGKIAAAAIPNSMNDLLTLCLRANPSDNSQSLTYAAALRPDQEGADDASARQSRTR